MQMFQSGQKKIKNTAKHCHLLVLNVFDDSRLLFRLKQKTMTFAVLFSFITILTSNFGIFFVDFFGDSKGLFLDL